MPTSIINTNHDPDKIELKVEYDKKFDVWRVDARLKEGKKCR